MRIKKAASRYAKALLDLAVEQKSTDEVNEDMKSFLSLIDSSAEFKSMLKSRVINDDKKLSVITAIFEGKVCELTLKFIALLSRKERTHLLPDVAFDYTRKYEEHNLILRMRLISARQLDEETRSAIKSAISSDKWKEIIFEEEIDEEIIGGFILQTDYVRFDAGVKSKLNELKQSFLNKAVTA